MNHLYPLIVNLILCLQVVAQKPDTLVRNAMIRRLDSLQTSLFLEHGTVSACIKSTKTGLSILAYQHRKAMPPASTMKLITTATVMSVLNENYSYVTLLQTDGIIRNDSLLGNVWIKGSGDPSLGSGRFKDSPDLNDLLKIWVAALRKKGIRHISGSVIGDASVFDENTVPDGWVWEDVGNYYGAGVSGLNVNENIYRVYFLPANNLYEIAGVARVIPELSGVAMVNRVLMDEAGTGDQVTIYSSPFGNQILLDGYIPRGRSEFPVKGAIPNPATFAAQQLRNAIIQADISIGGGAYSSFEFIRKGKITFPSDTLLAVQSPVLKDLVAECNYQSINLYAEAFLRTIAVAKKYGNTTKAGINALTQFWKSKNLDLSGFKIKDGSGLSPQSVLTTDNMTDILTMASREPSFQAFYATIPVLGRDGTVKNLGKGTKAAGNVRAKSGSIGGVRTYAGYFTSKSGEQYSFAFFFEHYDSDFGSATKELEKLMVSMVNL
ncbi:MAG: D-alanyl-D-alanine carboxypeptidase/D-alanyl-D-alanine-endopeptidase [Siphonobacter sp.]